MTMTLRPRNPWEGADLGVAMLRAWWRPLYAAAACVLAPIALAAHLAIDSPLVALLLVWWLKPLYDRVLLHVLARALFGSAPSVRQTLAALPQLVRGTGLAGGLTVRRIDTARSFNLPVRQLEGQAGKAARARERLLARRMGAQTSALLYCCIAFEVVVAVSLVALLELLTPAAIEADYGIGAFLATLFDPAAAGQWDWIGNAFMIAAIWAIEPLYVAAGFALYLNRRTSLEAWDLELRFRRLQAEPPRTNAIAAVLCAVLALCGALLAPGPAAVAAERGSREIIAEVLDAPEFQEQRTHKVWQPRKKAEERTDGASSTKLAQLLQSLSLSAAQLLRILAYAGLAIALFLVGRFVWRQLSTMERKEGASAAPGAHETVFGLDVRPEALPADLAQLAAASAAADPRRALSLLYRGALVTLIHRDRLRIEDGDTEADCVRRVETAGPQPRAEYFAAVVAAWTQCAYGHRPLQPEQIERLCAQWPQHFAAPDAP